MPDDKLIEIIDAGAGSQAHSSSFWKTYCKFLIISKLAFTTCFVLILKFDELVILLSLTFFKVN